MRYITVFLLVFIPLTLSAQNFQRQKVSATIHNSQNLMPLINVNIINIDKAKGASTNEFGYFEIEAEANDTLHISMIGFQSIRVRVTNDWIKKGSTKIYLTEKAIALEEVKVRKYNLTGYLEIDTKYIPEKTVSYRYSISGLPNAYEAGENSPKAFSRVMNSIFNPADMLYNFFAKKPKELRKLKDMKKDDKVRNLLETKFDRETIAVLLGIDKKEIAEILTNCNYSETFIETANDLQILDAISQCYEEYKVLKKN
ncbi:carboxypeptidase-like protein [Flavobacterium croceum DSM 17960]|uniref:Carboxypeptidase-like protein n=1 Tax=Flavobacterium croceum DSM 17960 TaxID=1121886 RepID=A0A2S4N8J4_9FLAO|nr:carboxypeptidase-like regulatory domain-containing protein [Flavobacterium croceum]POS02021.1 carboxypeptidase-like protein [Flavobacterium croceum DSM 17960]